VDPSAPARAVAAAVKALVPLQISACFSPAKRWPRLIGHFEACAFDVLIVNVRRTIYQPNKIMASLW